MGRIKSTAIKTLGVDIIKANPGRFGKEFSKNKKVLTEVRPVKSKRTRNIVAGYITRKMKTANPEEGVA